MVRSLVNSAEPKTSFDRLVEFIGREYGLVIDKRRREMLGTRLQRHIINLGLDSMDTYADYLMQQGALNKELTVLLNAATTRTTSFFREKNHFYFLHKTYIPELVQKYDGKNFHFKVWSGAGSTGMEAYTLAMVLDHAKTQQKLNMDYTVYASDISEKAIKGIQHAIYSREEIEPVPNEMREKYMLTHKDTSINQVRMAPSIRDKVKVFVNNLMSREYKDVPKSLDLILLRNVLIYFDQDTQKQIIETSLKHLKTDGILMVGHSENVQDYRSHGLESVKPATYRKVNS